MKEGKTKFKRRLERNKSNYKSNLNKRWTDNVKKYK